VEETEVELSKLNERKKDLTDDGRYWDHHARREKNLVLYVNMVN
jgi:hypothetical protein